MANSIQHMRVILGQTLILGECLDVMEEELGCLKFDAVVCDLPYGTTQCKWDSIVPLDEMWSGLKAITKPDANFVFTAAQPFTSALVMSNPKAFKYDIVWKKPKGTGHLNAKKQVMRNKEDVLVFCHGKGTYNPQMTKGDAYKAKPGRSKANGEDCYGQYKDVREDNTGVRYPLQIQEFPIVERNKLHPSQKPVELMEWLINTYSNEGDTVLDITMGSGSTLVAARNTNRKGYGIEKDNDFYYAAIGRFLKIEDSQLSL